MVILLMSQPEELHGVRPSSVLLVVSTGWSPFSPIIRELWIAIHGHEAETLLSSTASSASGSDTGSRYAVSL